MLNASSLTQCCASLWSSSICQPSTLSPPHFLSAPFTLFQSKKWKEQWMQVSDGDQYTTKLLPEAIASDGHMYVPITREQVPGRKYSSILPSDSQINLHRWKMYLLIDCFADKHSSCSNSLLCHKQLLNALRRKLICCFNTHTLYVSAKDLYLSRMQVLFTP